MQRVKRFSHAAGAGAFGGLMVITLLALLGFTPVVGHTTDVAVATLWTAQSTEATTDTVTFSLAYGEACYSWNIVQPDPPSTATLVARESPDSNEWYNGLTLVDSSASSTSGFTCTNPSLRYGDLQLTLAGTNTVVITAHVSRRN